MLKWDEDRAKIKKYKKFESLWFEPYMIARCIGKNLFEIDKLNGWKLLILVNG